LGAFLMTSPQGTICNTVTQPAAITSSTHGLNKKPLSSVS
jgi:hypothetical protein